jgi:ribulose-phosphate 3-epimerase
MIVIPSPFTSDINELKNYISQAENLPAGRQVKVEIFQIDINDGTFLSNKSVTPEELQGITTNLKLDFHLMVDNPTIWIDRCMAVGAARIIGQTEYMTNERDFVEKCQRVGVKIGLALDINTEISRLDPTILSDLDVILVMDYPAGMGGQVFDDRVLAKIKILDKTRKSNNYKYHICCDG